MFPWGRVMSAGDDGAAWEGSFPLVGDTMITDVLFPVLWTVASPAGPPHAGEEGCEGSRPAVVASVTDSLSKPGP